MNFGDYVTVLWIYALVTVLVLWGLYVMALTYLYLFDDEWRQLIREGYGQKIRRLRLLLALAVISTAIWAQRLYIKLGRAREERS